jgi:hypothetical protein
MSTAEIIDRLDQIIDLVSRPQVDHGRGGLSETRRKTVERLLILLRDEVSRSDD